MTTTYLAIVKQDCPTCTLIVPALAELAMATALTIYTQDDTEFLASVTDATVTLDDTLEVSFNHEIETVPTLIKLQDDAEVERIIGWSKSEWQTFTALAGLGADLPDWRPGCGAKNVEPHIKDELTLRFGDSGIKARQIEVSDIEDEIEACFSRDWSDGLPVVPPTELRVYRMLQGTARDSAEVLGHMPHNKAPVSIEKVAINAVMAGCKPEYMPVVIAAVEAALEPAYGMQAFMASTWFSAPVVVVNGPITKQIGMNSGFSAFGSGNRANATIGRALNLCIRNIGEVRAGEVARSTFGNPGRFTWCFAENEDNTTWTSLATERGVPVGESAVTVLTGDGVQPLGDEKSRTPESLILSLSGALKTVYHPKWAVDEDVILGVSPEHSAVFERAGWTKADVRKALEANLMLPSAEMVKGAGGCAEGMEPDYVAANPIVSKFLPGGIHIIRVGSNAGLYTAIIACWPNGGETGTQPVTKIIR